MKNTDRLCINFSAKSHTGVEILLDQRTFFYCSLFLEEYQLPWYPSRISIEFSPKYVYPTMAWKKLKIMVIKLMGNEFISQSIESEHF